jgi:hypothetical protein
VIKVLHHAHTCTAQVNVVVEATAHGQLDSAAVNLLADNGQCGFQLGSFTPIVETHPFVDDLTVTTGVSLHR